MMARLLVQAPGLAYLPAISMAAMLRVVWNMSEAIWLLQSEYALQPQR